MQLQGAQPGVPSSHSLPCLCSACSPGQEQEHEGCSPRFWRALCVPTMGAGISISSWSMARQPWERQALFHGKVLLEGIPLWPAQPRLPWALVLHCVPSAVGLCPACCLIPVSPWLPPPLSTGNLPQGSPKGSPAREAPPKLGLHGARLSLGFVTEDSNEPSWGSPADKARRKRSLQASPGSDAVSPSQLLVPSLAAGSRKSRLTGAQGRAVSPQLCHWQVLSERGQEPSLSPGQPGPDPRAGAIVCPFVWASAQPCPSRRQHNGSFFRPALGEMNSEVLPRKRPVYK